MDQTQSISSETKQELHSQSSFKLSLILIGIFLILAAGIGGVYLGKYLYAPKIPAATEISTGILSVTPTIDPIADWRQISRKNWSFKMPSEWHYWECSNTDSIFIGPGIDRDRVDECAFEGTGIISISREPSKPKPWDTLDDTSELISREEIIVDGKSATKQRILIKEGQGQGKWIFVYIPNPDYTDLISLSNNQNQDYSLIFDQILSTFKSIDKTSTSLKQPDSQTPAAGICAEQTSSTLAIVDLNVDTASPRCLKVRADQQLKVVNNTNQSVRVTLGRLQSTISPGGNYMDGEEFGSYLAPGVHSVEVIPAFSFEIWLK